MFFLIHTHVAGTDFFLVYTIKGHRDGFNFVAYIIFQLKIIKIN